MAPLVAGAFGIYQTREVIADILGQQLAAPKAAALWRGNAPAWIGAVVALALAVEMALLATVMIRALRSRRAGEWIVRHPFYKQAPEARRLTAFAVRQLKPDQRSGALPEPKLRQVMERNRTYVWRIARRKGRSVGKLQGYFVLAALTEQATQDVLSGKIQNGHHIRVDDHLAPGMAGACGLYIFGVYARDDLNARIRTTAQLVRSIQQAMEGHSDIRYLFARPGTPHGAHLMEKYGFRTVPGSEIGVIERSEILDYTPTALKTIERFPVELEPDPDVDPFGMSAPV